MKRLFPLLLLVLLLAPPGFSSGATASPKKPNVVYIVADDMGYADCGVQG